MSTSPALALQLRVLAGTVAGDALAGGLAQIARDVCHQVPSCLAVSLSLARVHGEVTVSVFTNPTSSGIARSSLALPLTLASVPPGRGDVLLLQASRSGAFILLADDLAQLSVPAHPPVRVDEDLDLPPASPERVLAASLADARAVDQAVGVLLEQGLLPEEGLAELRRRAGAAGASLAAAGRTLLEGL